MIYYKRASEVRNNKRIRFVNKMLFKNAILRLVKQVYHNYEVYSINSYAKGSEIVYKKFAELLEKTNKTAYQISKDTGIAQSVLSEWKTGRIKMLGVDKLKILADYFDVRIEYFLEI